MNWVVFLSKIRSIQLVFSIMAIFLILPLFFLACFLVIPYGLVTTSRPRFKLAVRVWVIIFFVEMACITSLSPVKMYALGFQKVWGVHYTMVFVKELPKVIKGIFLGKANEFLVLLTVPIIPALFGFFAGYLLEIHRASKKNNP